MLVIWGKLDRFEDDPQGRRWVQLKAMLDGGTAIRIRALVGSHTLIARGTERVALSNLSAGEPVEISYRHGRGGVMEADTIYVRPDPAARA